MGREALRLHLQMPRLKAQMFSVPGRCIAAAMNSEDKTPCATKAALAIIFRIWCVKKLSAPQKEHVQLNPLTYILPYIYMYMFIYIHMFIYI